MTIMQLGYWVPYRSRAGGGREVTIKLIDATNLQESEQFGNCSVAVFRDFMGNRDKQVFT
jgi:hypothetical protein